MGKKARFEAGLISVFVYLAAGITFGMLLFIIGYILMKGIPHLSLDFFSWEYDSDNVSVIPSVFNTIVMAVVTLLIVVPIGIGAAIYTVEYAKRGSRIVKIVRITTETLQGIPSIIYGLFGLLFFVNALKWGQSMLAGAFTLAIMVLPVVMRTTEEALQAVPDSYREASFGLGAGRLRTVLRVVLPPAVPGILSGVILAIGRIVGETAALIYTSGTVAKLPGSLMESGRTIALHMWMLANEGLQEDKAYATAVILLIMVIVINFLSNKLAQKLAGTE